MLHLSILMENTAADGYFCEHGVSFLLDFGDAVILFDTGASDVFLKNAAKMGCDLGRVTHIVLSHGHFDHTGGLGAALRHIAGKKQKTALPPLIAHPDVLLHRRRPCGHPKGPKELGMPEDSRTALAGWPVTFSREPVFIRENLVFLGEIPHTLPEMCVLIGEAEHNGTYAPDMLFDDTALVYITDKGLVIIAGCSHSGILNIIAHAREVTGVATIRAVYGGLHCVDMTPENIAKTRKALADEQLMELFACHCTGEALKDVPEALFLEAGMQHRL